MVLVAEGPVKEIPVRKDEEDRRGRSHSPNMAQIVGDTKDHAAAIIRREENWDDQGKDIMDQAAVLTIRG